MENGVDATNDGRAVYISYGYTKYCSGFLYSERIVFTAAHCVIDNKTNETLNYLSVGYPGQKYTKSAETISIEKVFIPKNWEWNNKSNISAINDFAILITSRSIPIVGKTFIATKKDIELFLNDKIKISTIGYGRQSSLHGYNDDTVPQYAEFPIVPDNYVQGKLQAISSYLGGSIRYDMKIHVLQIPGGASSCSGDSGSPFYVKKEHDYIYLGPLAWGLGGIPNCSGAGWTDNVMYMGSVAAYDYLDLIKEAENYIGHNTIDYNNKVTIKCFKDKKIKIIKGKKPRCPKGYKLKV